MAAAQLSQADIDFLREGRKEKRLGRTKAGFRKTFVLKENLDQALADYEHREPSMNKSKYLKARGLYLQNQAQQNANKKPSEKRVVPSAYEQKLSKKPKSVASRQRARRLSASCTYDHPCQLPGDKVLSRVLKDLNGQKAHRKAKEEEKLNQSLYGMYKRIDENGKEVYAVNRSRSKKRSANKSYKVTKSNGLKITLSKR